jgi:hypothetical protein
MLVDLRTYTTRPGTTAKQLALYRDYGYDIQRRYVGEPMAFLVTESGELNSYVHLWRYESAAQRELARAALQKDPDWLAYLAKSAEAGNLVSQENRLLIPAPFWNQK